MPNILNFKLSPQAQIFPKGLYIHSPFCIKKCAYCAFASTAFNVLKKNNQLNDTDLLEAYFRDLDFQLNLLKERDIEPQPLETLYFGGGTPTIFTNDFIERLISGISQRLSFQSNAEWTIEMNPENHTRIDLKALKTLGFNRLSVGLQSSDSHLLKLLGRVHSLEDFSATIKLAKNSGFQNISADIMFGLPSQTIQDLKNTLDYLLSFNLQHLSAYSLSIEEGTAFYQRYKGKENLLPSPEEERAFAYYLREILEANQYTAYEISNFSKDGFESQHNSNYWKTEPYFGIGSGAASYLAGLRRTETEVLDDWLRLEPNQDRLSSEKWIQPAPLFEEWISDEEAEKEFFIFGFRLLKGLDISLFEKRFQRSISKRSIQILEKYLASKYLEQVSDSIYKLTRKGEDFADEINRDFI